MFPCRPVRRMNHLSQTTKLLGIYNHNEYRASLRSWLPSFRISSYPSWPEWWPDERPKKKDVCICSFFRPMGAADFFFASCRCWIHLVTASSLVMCIGCEKLLFSSSWHIQQIRKFFCIGDQPKRSNLFFCDRNAYLKLFWIPEKSRNT